MPKRDRQDAPLLDMYGTCSGQGAAAVRELGGVPIDDKNTDFVKEIHRLTGDGVDAVLYLPSSAKPRSSRRWLARVSNNRCPHVHY